MSAYYAVRIDGKTRVLTSQSVLPIPEDVAQQIMRMIADGLPEELIVGEIVDYMGG